MHKTDAHQVSLGIAEAPIMCVTELPARLLTEAGLISLGYAGERQSQLEGTATRKTRAINSCLKQNPPVDLASGDLDFLKLVVMCSRTLVSRFQWWK